ncbi:MAG: radical SAM protein [Deltaproteobacteria bacterium]|nr:radical SAM protein [Deltaproteobacteria bacterium]MBW2141054.1 radical SAM protein [Deltaproteobacteria bacterium]
MSKDPFTFPIDGNSKSWSNNLNDLFGTLLRELFSFLVPTRDYQDIRVNGYKMLNDRDTIHPLYPLEVEESRAPCGPLDLYEPRICFIQRALESLLGIIDLEANGKTVQVDGFRLKDLKQWLGPGGGVSDIIGHAAARCNLNCRFCYNQGTPPSLTPAPGKAADEHKEIQERIKNYVPSAKLNIFPNMGSPAEALAHPHILDILTGLRQKTSEPFRFSTNGSTLTQEMIQALTILKPVYLDLSLNSSSPERRQWLMRDPEPQIALESLAHLKNAEIPYSVVIVPWPFPTSKIMLDDLRKTVAYAAAFDPTLIQISLPGYSQAFSKEPLFSHDEVWGIVKSEVQLLRSGTECPIVIRPGLFEEYTDPDRLNDPVLIGVIKNSPLAKTGLRQGDRILKINGLPVKNRPQTRSLLTLLHESEMKEASLSIQRDGAMRDLDLNLLNFDYPFTPETATHLGGVFPSSGVPLEWVEKLRDMVLSRKAQEVLLLTSILVQPFLEKNLKDSGFFSGINTHIRVPENGYFGGNIFMGDLMVVEDFIKAIEKFIDESKRRPDLVAIPSSPFSLSGWGRDLTGRVYLDIERRTKVPVALIECDPIFD